MAKRKKKPIPIVLPTPAPSLPEPNQPDLPKYSFINCISQYFTLKFIQKPGLRRRPIILHSNSSVMSLEFKPLNSLPKYFSIHCSSTIFLFRKRLEPGTLASAPGFTHELHGQIFLPKIFSIHCICSDFILSPGWALGLNAKVMRHQT